MASETTPPSARVDAPPQTTAHAQLPSQTPSIVFAPTSDGESDEDGFPIEIDDALTPFQKQRQYDEIHPHDAALLRRSHSPQLISLSSSTPYPALSTSPSSSAGLLSPDAFRTSFVRPPRSAMRDGSEAGDISASSLPIPTSSTGSTSTTAPTNGIGSSPAANPFNFQTEYISTSSVKSNIGLRRGHRYKHSSVSAQHQIFQEPPQRPPPVLPASLPLPTLREAWSSMQRDQRARLYWCLCHGAVAVFVFLCATLEGSGDSLALTALSHLVFFDVGSAAVCVAVDVLGNFEVWRRSTIRYPFGLRRAEVLTGFAMSIFLVFGGFDLLSHDLKDWFEAATAAANTSGAASATAAARGDGSGFVGENHYHHDGHGHHTRYVHPGTVDIPALAAFASTLVSAYGLGNHARIRRALLLQHGVPPYSSTRSAVSTAGKKGHLGEASSSSPLPASLAPSTPSSVFSIIASIIARMPGLPAAMANPFHFLTLGVSLVLLVLPLMFVAVQPWLDRLLCATIALSMLLLGARLATAQGLMLLMSFAGKPQPVSPSGTANGNLGGSVSFVLDEIAAEPQIARVEDAQFWQVHYGLCMANLRLRVVRGCDDGALRQLRTRVARVIQNRLGEGYGRGNSLRWEVTVQTSVEGR
ncbi:cation efflux family protein [Grosmannia clavigera kw1407]|uniref:Zinc transporter n=1 Tax=Grosmannia clavigera (strain kw1407 / UAMH 11150) TaxID=655863 RepID=F0XLK9_GROCL|nr:cation efflux family protein [Grosmannia clavigera kw1407]EFX00993.1 cation efflux family protein [Grosmannia clavigera kw1407]